MERIQDEMFMLVYESESDGPDVRGQVNWVDDYVMSRHMSGMGGSSQTKRGDWRPFCLSHPIKICN